MEMIELVAMLGSSLILFGSVAIVLLAEMGPGISKVWLHEPLTL